jgi:hypothetical protein
MITPPLPPLQTIRYNQENAGIIWITHGFPRIPRGLKNDPMNVPGPDASSAQDEIVQINDNRYMD